MPGRVKRRLYGFGGVFAGAVMTRRSPELATIDGLDKVPPPCGSSANGSSRSCGAFPLHQNGFPAASVTVGCGLPVCGTMKGGFVIVPGKVTVWKPRNCHVIVWPTRIVTWDGKNVSASACLIPA